MKNITSCLFLLLLFLSSCQSKKLPILGDSDVVKKIVDGKEVEETVYPVIPDFSFQNQYGETVTAKDFDGKIYVADFFFTTCPTICPPMKRNLLKVYKAFQDNPEVKILSHTIDPDHDTVPILSTYAKDLGVTGTMWQFVTGDREKIYEIGQKHYMVSAREDSSEAGGYIHSGHFVLVDKNKQIRGMYDGTTDEGTKELMKDIEILLKE
ncbi:SCO family protein [Dyadobacter psychrotolerans]|uniref:SCO family protein n=1 Tax=Dyadobacter psychrotolerans TaxID=2541721 RepID=A0A4R5DEM9_9BACT|nr:SCO family protein [Dyadobacter psychrotolerans]TDE11577.1 SCO family protein [Dyadobacter psychrotolerans]